MFAFTKQQKAVKTLKKLSDTYSALENEKNSEKDSLQICILKNEKRDIDKEKIAIHYDALKLEIENFNIVTTHKDMWKIEKPAKAEGMVFEVTMSAASMYGNLYVDTSTFSTTFGVTVDAYRQAMKESLDRTGKMGLANFFSSAILKKIKEDEEAKRKNYWKDLTGEDYLPSVTLYIASTLIETQKDTILYLNGNLLYLNGNLFGVPSPELSLLAKHHKINIGIIK